MPGLPLDVRLEYLNLDCNILGPAGTAELAGAFRAGACARLRQLYLRNNDVQGQVGRYLILRLTTHIKGRQIVALISCPLFLSCVYP
jgi:hypothetical protein